MADLNQFIGADEGLVAGDHFDIERTCLDLPEGRTVETAWFTCLEGTSENDPKLFEKEITDVDVAAQGHITDPGSGEGKDRKAVVLFRLQPSETRQAGTDLRKWDVQLKLDNGRITTPFAGELQAAGDATKATT